jgi:hypothetical protein
MRVSAVASLFLLSSAYLLILGLLMLFMAWAGLNGCRVSLTQRT